MSTVSPYGPAPMSWLDGFDRSAHLLRDNGNRVLNHAEGDNRDIIRTVLNAANKYHAQAKEFARATRIMRKGAATELPLQNCHALFAWAKSRIRYAVDPEGWQFIQSPGALWKSRLGDCKSFTVLISSVLRYWGVPHVIRFTSKSADADAPYTHVYVVATINGREVAVDPVWTTFGTEHEHSKQKDFTMKVATVSGVGRAKAPKLDISKITDAGLSLQIHRQRLALKAAIARKKGVPRLEKQYQKQLAQTDNLIEAEKEGPDAVDAAIDDISIGGIGRRDKPRRANPDKPKPKRLENLGEKIKKGAAAAIKVVTAPARLVAKGALEVLIPKAAVFFKYLFVTNPDMIKRMPEAARKKRKKAEEVAKFITEGLGMKSQHFMGLVRNGILKQEGMEPEALLAKELGGKVSGIGLIDDAIKVVLELIEQISKIAGKKGPKVSKEDFPDAARDGFGPPGSGSAASWVNDIKKEKADDLDGTAETGGPRKSIC